MVGSRCVHMASRKGPALWNIQHQDMKDLRCMSFTSKGAAEIVVAGWQNVMFVIDVNKGEIVKHVATEHYYSIMKKSRNICAATNKGCVNLLDPVSFKVLRTWQAHSASINDMDAKGDFIVTCGSHTKHQSPAPNLDSYVNVYDLRNMTSMNPIPFPSLAAHARVHPRMLTTTLVTSQLGQIHVVDIMNPNTSTVRYTHVTSYVTLFDVAPSGRAVALAESQTISLWGSQHDAIQFTDLAQPLVMPDPQPEPPEMDWSPNTPLSKIGMPFYREVLFSAWPTDIISDMGAPPTTFDQSYLNTLKKTEWGYYGKNSKGTRRNYIEDTRTKPLSAARPKFLSEKARESVSAFGQDQSEDGYDQISAALDPSSPYKLESLKPEPPPMYSLLEIMYSKFGVDDFDFGYYNKTRYSGLQNQIPNSTANALLQLMHYTPLLRNMALQHTATACLVEGCFLCEMGFVFDMLQKSEGVACHATNMFRTIAADTQAQNESLVELDDRSQSMGPPRPVQPPPALIQSLNRLLMDRMGAEYRSIHPISTKLEEALLNIGQPVNLDEVVQKVLTTDTTLRIRCNNCKTDTTRFSKSHIIDLIYPPQQKQPSAPLRGSGRAPKMSFSQVLKAGVEKENNCKGWCAKCKRYQNLTFHKTIHNIAAVLAINTAIVLQEHRKLWETPKWLPEEIGIIIKDGQFFCFEGEDLRTHLQRGAHNITVYSLIGMVVNIEHKPPSKPHLVSIINGEFFIICEFYERKRTLTFIPCSTVAHSEEEPGGSKWHLFNDFAVRPISASEALTFNSGWKMPSVVTYQVKTANNKRNMEWKERLDTSILYRDFNPRQEDKPYEILDPETERPGPDTVFAIDTEYVSLKQAELLLTSQGDKETIRPAFHALGRVSLVRALGEKEGVAFVDDWINIKEDVVDYLTPFSGISSEDLDVKTSRHTLVPLKIAYKKLWVLLNLGCKFLGHGLRTDFRVIDIFVPRAQVIDTSLLFHLKERLRWLGLALLADIIFGIKIQKGAKGHDSIEDARMSLKLYRKYLEWVDAGILNGELVRVYNEGKKRHFKASRDDDVVTSSGLGTAVGGGSGGAGVGLASPSRIGTPATVLVEGMGGLGLGLGAATGANAIGVPTTPTREHPPSTSFTTPGTTTTTMGNTGGGGPGSSNMRGTVNGSPSPLPRVP